MLSAVAVALVSLLAGCGASGSHPVSGSVSPHPASPSAMHRTKQEQAQGQVTVPAGTLTGFGATKAAWLATHKQAPGFVKGSAFLPMVTSGGETVPKYGGVDLSTPVVSYTINLPSGTGYSTALQTALAEFPNDAHVAKSGQPDSSCKIVIIQSPKVSRAIRKHGYKHWVPAVAMETHGGASAYSASSISDLTMVVVPTHPSPPSSC